MKIAALLASTLILLACSLQPTAGPPITSHAASPSPAAASPSPAQFGATDLGVFTGSATDPAGVYSVRIVNAAGAIKASRLAAAGGDEIPRPLVFGRIPVFLPQLSLSGSRVYFPDGDGQLRSLAVNGSSAIVHQLPNVRGKTRAVFAVSPDDKRIAIALFDWSASPMSLRLYVEDLAGGGAQVDILSSTSIYAWPVAWHEGNLVLAVNPVPNASNPYGAGAYHVVRASDGTRLAVMGGPDCLVVGALSPAGTACASDCDPNFTCLESVDWTGTRTVVYRRSNGQGSGASWSSLSPDGAAVTIGAQGPGDGVATRAGVILFGGNVVDLRNWWIDRDHVLAWLCVGGNLGGCTDQIGAINVATGSPLPGAIDTSAATPIGWFSANPNS